ncbi:MAG TPA: serine/threonine-protein kinase [Kofleriaceae bacterium]|nr:serine/threonine-protein kinase [Kofleriaceae bacterium]
MLGVSGKYRLDTRLGGGGMAEVFIGSTMGAEGFSRKVAIKRVLPGFSDNEAFAKMFVSEARISSQLVHPNIVSVLDFDRDAENRLFLVMELVEGKDLDALVSTGVLPVPVVIFVIGEVLRGLGYAHDLPVGNETRGIVHRDISPHNVLLSWSGAVKVSDFGIAKARAASEATASVFIKGKPAYMSPEQANGQPLDGRSDLFAVGIMLWEMLVGRRLFVGEDTRATLAAVLFGQIPRPRSIRGDIPKDLERVVMKLLERDLPARYATAEDALVDLMACHDAPKSGREALVAALTERFPGEAPVRQSLMRQRQEQAQSPASGVPLHLQPTVATPGAALPSLGAVRNAPTGTVDLMPRRRSKLWLVPIVTLGSGLATFGIVSAVKSKAPAPAAGSDAGVASGSDLAAHATTPDAPPPIDAAPPPPIDAPPAPVVADAAPPVDAQKAAPVVEKKYGSLKVISDPPATVIVDGKQMGEAPNTFKLTAGKHTVRLLNTDAGIDVTKRVTVLANQTTELNRNK